MATNEIKRIEKELMIDLPAHYAAFLSAFHGLDHAEIDIENFIYSNTDDIIEMNRLIGFHLEDKVIKKKLIIGDNGCGDFYLIDLVNPSDKRVYVFAHEETENNFDNETQTINWEGFEKYDTLESYRDFLQETFG